jgi:hypothetical protein
MVLHLYATETTVYVEIINDVAKYPDLERDTDGNGFYV